MFCRIEEGMNSLLNLIKRLLPRSVKNVIIGVRQLCLLAVLWFFSRTRWLSSFYYCFFSRHFAREHQSVLQGRLTYLSSQGKQTQTNIPTNTLLRRNIHRIEKGLIMQPRKAVFALNYIADTVAAYGVASSNVDHDDQELKWARDVLSAYFTAVQRDLLPTGLLLTFEAAKQADPAVQQSAEQSEKQSKEQSKEQNEEQDSIPYDFASKPQAQVSADDFLTLCTQRRSVRWFEQKAVPRDLLEQAVTMASLAPSACNRQPYQFYIADDDVLSQQLINTPGGTKGFGHNVPCTIVVTADLANYASERDRHLIYIDSTLASMQLMLALETLGLSSCPINWPDIEAKEQQMQRLLGLSASQRPVMLIAVGYGLAEGKIPFSHKKSAKQLIRYVPRQNDR
ncbi:MAG: nitroreductase [Phenylobacterium sp.]|jgi:nitroreductase